jgi:hypothetical protein
MGEPKERKQKVRKPAKEISEEQFKALQKSKVGPFKMRQVYGTTDATLVHVFFLASL